MNQIEVGIWLWNGIRGDWKLARRCFRETAPEWLDVFRRHDPAATYTISTRRPTRKPVSQHG